MNILNPSDYKKENIVKIDKERFLLATIWRLYISVFQWKEPTYPWDAWWWAEGDESKAPASLKWNLSDSTKTVLYLYQL